VGGFVFLERQDYDGGDDQNDTFVVTPTNGNGQPRDRVQFELQGEGELYCDGVAKVSKTVFLDRVTGESWLGCPNPFRGGWDEIRLEAYAHGKWPTAPAVTI
jgi:hypothetical protein